MKSKKPTKLSSQNLKRTQGGIPVKTNVSAGSITFVKEQGGIGGMLGGLLGGGKEGGGGLGGIL